MNDEWCDELPSKFCDIEIHESVIMPNHFHAIIENSGNIINNPINWYKDKLNSLIYN
jgi:REP element-mobilizing transposase RayT